MTDTYKVVRWLIAMGWNKLSCIVLLLISISPQLNSQMFFQLEKANSLKVKKFSTGDHITFKLKQFDDEWISGSILRILPKDDAVVFYDQIVYLDEMTHFQYHNQWANNLGNTFMGFGAGWLLFGGAIEGLRSIDAIETDYKFGTDTAVIGLTALASGYLTKKLWGKVVIKLNKRNRVRIVDVRF